MKSDAELVRRVQEGNVCAYATLVRRYERTAFVVALQILKDRQAAEDVVQDSFVIAFRQLKSLRDGAKFGPWLTKVTSREAIRNKRRQRRALPLDMDVAAAPVDVDVNSHAELLEQVARLPSHERLVISLHYLSGCSTKEISNITGRPVGTITKQLSRAIARMRRGLAEEGHSDET